MSIQSYPHLLRNFHQQCRQEFEAMVFTFGSSWRLLQCTKIRFTKPPQLESKTSEACSHVTMVLQEFMNYQWSTTTLWTLNWFLCFFLPSPRVKHINATCKKAAARSSEVHTKVSFPHLESKSAFQNWVRWVHRQQVSEWVPKASDRTRPSLVPGRSGCWWRSQERGVGCVQACRLPLSIILITLLG